MTDGLTQRIIGCVIRVHQTLGPGFVESVYKRAMLIELPKHGLTTETEVEVVITYNGEEVGRHRLDLLVEGQVIVEIKAVEAFNKVHYSQLRSYLKATGLEVGLLVNFATERADFRRIIAPFNP